MSGSPRVHLDLPAFRAAVERTARDFDFRPALVEKDYFCSLLIKAVSAPESGLIFKGGTCLSKIYADFYRLSEDLDFCIPVHAGIRRPARRQLIDPVKKIIRALPSRAAGVELEEPLGGRNESTQYVAAIRYRSVITAGWEKVKIEIALREPLFLPAAVQNARTLIRNVFTGEELMPPFAVRAIDLAEALAEKTRAALARREAAIRDFFDLHFALEHLELRLDDPVFLGLLRKKLAVPGTERVQLTTERLRALEQQSRTELPAVLRTKDIEKFDLGRIWTALTRLAEKLESV
jgi:predicted nucleotidyltransferase component of viral defense system